MSDDKKPPLNPTRRKKSDGGNLTPLSPQMLARRPAGRPKGSKNNATVIKEILAIVGSTVKDKEVQKAAKNLGRELSLREIMHYRQIIKAIKGDTYAYNAVMDREDGKPRQTNHNLSVTVTLEDYLKTQPDPGDEQTE